MWQKFPRIRPKLYFFEKLFPPYFEVFSPKLRKKIKLEKLENEMTKCSLSKKKAFILPKAIFEKVGGRKTYGRYPGVLLKLIVQKWLCRLNEIVKFLAFAKLEELINVIELARRSGNLLHFLSLIVGTWLRVFNASGN